jgi:hypothetical protein
MQFAFNNSSLKFQRSSYASTFTIGSAVAAVSEQSLSASYLV